MAEVQSPGSLNVSPKIKTISAVFMFLGIAAFVVTMLTDKSRAWHSYLIGLFFFSSIAIGGLFFAAIQHMTKAGWSVNIRRFSEALTAFLPWAAGLSAVLIIGAPTLYSWLDPQVIATDHLIQHKSAYLNMPFFIIRLIAFFGLWMFFAKKIVGKSLKQDEDGDENLTHKLVPWSVGFIILFALTYSLFSVDTLMSLEPHWFSTIFGVYCFSGLFQTTVAAIILISVYLMKKGLLKGFVDENHLHDLGKFLFAFTVFWAYIAFSQYMLIWYANLPEETLFFMPRQTGSWLMVSAALIIFKFIVPFVALLPQWAKRNPTHLVAVSLLIMVMQYVDLYWLVYPNYNEEHVVFGLQEVFIFLGFAGAFIFAVTRFLSKHALVPYKDPRIQESTHHHVVY